MSINEILNQDIFNLLLSIHYKLNIDLNELLTKYMPNISIEKHKEKKTRIKKDRKERYKFEEDYQCKARCW